jgi:uncharacterized protein involved in exopolysaccharide biosynthesis
MDTRTDNPLQEDEISLKELIQEIWQRRWFVSALTVLFTLGAFVVAWRMPRMYTASVVLSPATNTPGGQSGGLSSMISQFGGLASLAGLAVNSDSRRSESIAFLQSESLTESYIRDNRLLPILYHSRWDSLANRWKGRAPTVWQAGELFKKSVRIVTIDTKTGLVTLSIMWRDPQLASDWANGLVRMANDDLRGKAITESQRNIDYLNQQAVRTDLIGVKQAIYSLLENEINKEMLARGSEEYALKVIDPAIAPELPSSPKIPLWTLLGTFSGLVLSLFAVFVRLAWVRG